MIKVKLHNQLVEFDKCLDQMNAELRDELNKDPNFIDCSDQEFLTAYKKRHFEKFGEDFHI